MSGLRVLLGKYSFRIANLPDSVRHKLEDLHDELWHEFGGVRVEWVFDGDNLWVIQLQQEESKSTGTVIVDGDFSSELTFHAEQGLEKLRDLTTRLSGSPAAIKLVGNVGITSHMADVLRRANIPSRLVRD